MDTENHLLAVFLDFENLAVGFSNREEGFDVARVLKRLVERGHIVVKRAYADWQRFPRAASRLQEHAFELMQIPARRLSGKNSADMRLCVDVMDLCYSKAHIDTFVIVSGDSDFSPVVSKLKENGKTVIGLGVKESTSALLRDNCDEFIYYSDMQRSSATVPTTLKQVGEKELELFTLLLEALAALRRQNRDVLWASLIKETMKRMSPSFDESYYGFRSFSDLLEGAAKRGLVRIARDSSNRSTFVEAFGDELRGQESAAPAPRRRTRSSGPTGASAPPASTRRR